jgi:hypothetical protein
MDCEQALALLLAHMDRELEVDDRPRLEAHLRQCATCRASAEAYRVQDADLRRAFATRRHASTAVAERVVAHLRARPTRLRRHLPWLTVILSAAAGFLVAVLLFRPWAKIPVLGRERGPDIAAQPAEQVPTAPPETVVLALATDAKQACWGCSPVDSAWRALEAGSKIALGTRVRTPAGVRCEFRTRDGTEIRLNGETEVVFAGSRRLELDKGQILARVIEAAVPFQVTIPNATITSLGTEFDLLCKPVESVLTVLEGATKVEGKDQWRTVQTGEEATIVDGRVVRKQLLRRYTQVASWADALVKLKGPANKEANQRMSAMLDDLLVQLGSLKGDFSSEEIRSLGPQVVLPLTRYLQSERSKTPQEREKRQRTARILAEMAQPWSVADLIELLGDADGQVRYSAATALKRLTKETLGHEPKEWREKSPADLKDARAAWRTWWQKNKDRFPDTSLAMP